MNTSSHAVAHAGEPAHGNVTSYMVGFALSILLTAGSFATVMSNVVPHAWRLTAIVSLCVVQLLVQLVYFLHLGTRRSQGENTAIFACTALLIAIVVAGSLWVMHNADINMMPSPMSVGDAMSRP